MQSLFLIILSVFYVFTPSWLQSTSSVSNQVLVVGGAGYIGSHINEMLYLSGYQTIVLDNLSQGTRDSVLHGTFIEGDLEDSELLDRIFRTYQIDAVMHFAAYKDVGESVREPMNYYRNNVSNTLNLLEAMRRHQVKIMIFSSSAAIFGYPEEIPISEDHPCNPMSPYGRTKLIVEHILQDLDRADALRYISLRYFNAAGGDPLGKLRNFKKQDSNLIPIILRSLQKPDGFITIFGTDYPTEDGTCVRDYIHIEDLGTAHIAALKKLLTGSSSACYNLGNGKGFTVMEVIAAVEKVTGQKVKTKIGARRPGDPPILVASSAKARQELNWTPSYSSLEMIIEHAWNAMRSD